MNVTLTVKGIPEYAVTGITQSQLGRGYGVNSRYISAIVNFLERAS
jgi:hypothetical protein